MANYLIMRDETKEVWNFRTKRWTKRVTNGCRYKGVKTWRSGMTSPVSADRVQLRLMTQDIEASIYLEDYIRNDFYGSTIGQGLIFS